MLDPVKNIFRKRVLRKFISTEPTSLIPLSAIKTANVVIDVEEPGFDVLKEDILSWGRSEGIDVNIYFFDFRKLGKDELLLTSINTTIIKRELNWFGMPAADKVGELFREKSDLFISMVANGDFPIEFVSKCTRARFKIGRYPFAGHAYDMIMAGNAVEELRSDSRKIFSAITEFLKKIE
jgi:hypothetical protein